MTHCQTQELIVQRGPLPFAGEQSEVFGTILEDAQHLLVLVAQCELNTRVLHRLEAG